MRCGESGGRGHQPPQTPRPNRQTFCWIVPPGLRFAVPSVTNRPVDAERFTDRLFPVPEPTRSVVVLPGHRETVAFETNRPVLALRLTLRAMVDLFPSTPAPRQATCPKSLATAAQTGNLKLPPQTEREALARETPAGASRAL